MLYSYFMSNPSAMHILKYTLKSRETEMLTRPAQKRVA